MGKLFARLYAFCSAPQNAILNFWLVVKVARYQRDLFLKHSSSMADVFPMEIVFFTKSCLKNPCVHCVSF